MTEPRRQHGVALVTALLVIALAATAATALARHQQLAIQRSANVLNGEQAWHYALGAEAFARLVLRRDTGDVDHLQEGWATLVPPTLIDGGELYGQLEDLQGRFNLNNLVDANGAVAAQVAQFQRLLRLLEVAPGAAWNVVDWLDGDQDPSPAGGAEDLEYLRRDPAYRSAGRQLTSPSELLLIDGFDMDAYRRLQPHVTALPGTTPLNVNTATELLLETLDEGLGESVATQLADARGAEGFASVESFLDELEAAAGRDARDRVAQLPLAVGSTHFLFIGEARFGRGRARVASLLLREGGEVTTLRRSRGVL